MQKNLIVELTTDFALEIIKFTDILRETKKYELASQLFRSGTSIGANVREAQSPESRADFVHKLKIADKEAREVEYWLELCEKSDSLPEPGDLVNRIISIRKVLNKIIGTTVRR